ncbi:MAG: hypothetical protein MO853_12200 [Candidatus Protistobacter heckmanni]|nr:hypothetical protein [Candidatus Protistobacter heckmanni]
MQPVAAVQPVQPVQSITTVQPVQTVVSAPVDVVYPQLVYVESYPYYPYYRPSGRSPLASVSAGAAAGAIAGTAEKTLSVPQQN